MRDPAFHCNNTRILRQGPSAYWFRPGNTHSMVAMQCSMAAYSTSEGVKPASRMSASTAMALHG